MQTYQTFKIFNQLNYKSLCLIYLLQYRIYQLQEVGKKKVSFHIRLNNTINDSKSILDDKYFQSSNQIFQMDAKFTLIAEVTQTFTTIEQLRLLLKKREIFLILKLQTLSPDNFN